ncbi:MAG: adenosine deaminase family protein [Planctomycetota bacterium]|nr:adenosine deaminase family protein [Planctomycetota bacterium]
MIKTEGRDLLSAFFYFELDSVMGLADLHRHLDGSLRLSTLRDLASSHNPALVIPKDIYFHKGMGLDQALACFAVTLSVLQDPKSVTRVTAEICEDAEAEGVDCLEIRFAPQLHKGASLETIVDAALEGLDEKSTIILCALYGDPPELVDRLVEIAIPRRRVVALDLAGGPVPGHSWSMRDYSNAFQRARDHGLGRTVHAGEGRAPEEIAVAINELHALRIGHGTTLLDDFSVTDLILQKDIVIEACPSSNVHTGVISEVSAHPLKRWLELGVKVCVNTDNTLFSQIDAPTELELTRSIPGMTNDDLAQLVENGHNGRFRR